MNAECESVRLAADMGVSVEWYRGMFAACDCPDCDWPPPTKPTS